MSDAIKYDVAIPFLSADLDIAEKLTDLLRDRMQVFLFTERQGDVVGPDGIARMNAVYGEEARIAVVLYREGWGKKGWTGVEETAIKNRAMEKGWGFLLMVPLEEQPKLPPWVPRENIWLSYPHYGLDAGLPVIERLLEQLRGEVKPVTAATHLAQEARHNAWQKEREAKRGTVAGVTAAKEHVVALFAELQKTVSAEPTADISFKRVGDRAARIWTQAPDHEGTTVTFYWSQSWGNVLSQSGLHVRLWEGYAGAASEGPLAFEDAAEVGGHEFDFEWSESGQWVWQGRDTKRSYDTAALAALFVGLLIEHSRRPPKR